jgi:hypothetical protein
VVLLSILEDTTIPRYTLGLLWAPLAAEARPVQQMYRVGLVSIGGDPQWWRPFMEAMGELGYVEGCNLTAKRAFAKGRAEELPRLVHEVVRSAVMVHMRPDGISHPHTVPCEP